MAFALGALLLVASAAEPWTRQDVREAAATASPRVACTIGVETGQTYEPYSYGRAGELGPGQLHPRGKLPEFYAAGFTDPFDPWATVAFMEMEFARGNARAWSPVLLGMC